MTQQSKPEYPERELDAYQEFIMMSRYSRWIPSLARRENMDEVINRFIEYVFHDHLPNRLDYTADDDLIEEVRNAIRNLNVMPSMRCLMTAGKALRRDATCAYNCSYIAIDSPRSFDELLYVLMCGTGVGFSVERQYVSKLPVVPEKLHPCHTKLVVHDSKIGWASSFKQLIALLYAGQIPEWDVSKVRPAGVPLKTMGGRASGPAPLVRLFEFTIRLFQSAVGRKLSSFECHSLACMCGDIVVVGGVRRCIAENGLVKTKAGQVQIKDLKVGDDVLAMYGSYKQVLAKEHVGQKRIVSVYYSDNGRIGCLECTPEHRVALCKSDHEVEWICAGLLKKGDPLTRINEGQHPLRSPVTVVDVVVGAHLVDCWDIEVEEDASFVCDGVLVHNSALISLSNPSDTRMRHAKSGAWWEDKPYLSLANNSAAYTEIRPEMQLFFDEWKALYESKSGERGIFNRAAAKKHIERMNDLRSKIEDAAKRDSNREWGTNPCR